MKGELTETEKAVLKMFYDTTRNLLLTVSNDLYINDEYFGVNELFNLAVKIGLFEEEQAEEQREKI